MLLQIIKIIFTGLAISGLVGVFTFTDNNLLESSQNTQLYGTSYNTETNNNLHFLNKEQMVSGGLFLIIIIYLIYISNTQGILSDNLIILQNSVNNLQNNITNLHENNTTIMRNLITISERLSEIKFTLLREVINLKNDIIINNNTHHNGLIPHVDIQLQNIREELTIQIEHLARLATYVNYTRIFINRSSQLYNGFMQDHLSKQRQLAESLERVITMLQDLNSTENLTELKLNRILSILNNIQQQTSLLIAN